MTKKIEVAVGVIKRNNLYYMTKRLANVHQGGKWEFPGGKVESEESPENALKRELKEEVDIEVVSQSALITINHDYGDKQVILYVYIVDAFNGEPAAQEGQKEGWFSFEELVKLDLPAANQNIINALNK